MERDGGRERERLSLPPSPEHKALRGQPFSDGSRMVKFLSQFAFPSLLNFSLFEGAHSHCLLFAWIYI